MSDWKNVQYKDGKYRTSDEGGGGASALTDLTDVNVLSPSDGQVLKYDSTTQKWKNENESGGGSVNDVTLDGNSVINEQGTAVLTTPNVNDLKDTNISSPSSGQTLQYNATTQKWENAAPASGGNVDDVKVNGTSVVTNKVANITSYKEVTQAQYEALPDTKLSDNVLYAIKDGGQAVDGFPPLIYSDEEREIGVWTDGKPLYQKVINTNSTVVSGDTIVDISSLNIDKIVYIGGVFDRFVNNKHFWHEFNMFESTNAFAFVRIDSEGGHGTNGTLRAYIKFEGTTEQHFILQYTKTTDTPGSGTWNQQGAIAHHYSTTEKVIGTWIDGKPLYEKVITGLSISLSWNSQYRAENTFANAPTDIDTLVYIDGFGLSNGSHKTHFGITVYGYESNSWLLFSIEAGTVNTLVIQYTKTTD